VPDETEPEPASVSDAGPPAWGPAPLPGRPALASASMPPAPANSPSIAPGSFLGDDGGEASSDPSAASTTVRSGPSWVMHAARSPVRTNPEPEPGRWPVPPSPPAAPPPWREDAGAPALPTPDVPPRPPAPALEQTVDSILEELEEVPARRPRIPRLLAPAPPWSEGEEAAGPMPMPLVRSPYGAEAISGGRAAPATVPGTLPTYLRVLKNLVSHGGWLGTTTELARLTGEDPETVFASLLEYRSSLNQNNIVVATVEVEDGWRWLAVDRNKLQAGRPSSDRFGP